MSALCVCGGSAEPEPACQNPAGSHLGVVIGDTNALVGVPGFDNSANHMTVLFYHTNLAPVHAFNAEFHMAYCMLHCFFEV